MKSLYILVLLAAIAVFDIESLNPKNLLKTAKDATRKLNPLLARSVNKRAAKAKSECQCGIRKPKFGVVGGQRTTNKDFPWQAAITDKSGVHECTGSIISESWILTAAHCRIYPGYKIVVGSSNVRRIRNRQIRDVVEVIGYNGYSSMGPNDIMVIRVDRPFEYNDYVAPVCLPFNLEHLTLADEQAEFAGWGMFIRRARISSPILYKLHIRILSNEECQGYGEHPEVIESQICAEGERPTGVCSGDSGGPLVFEARPNQFAVVGLVSYGPTDCYKVDVYTRVTSFLDWIVQQTGVDDFCTPF